MDNNKNRMKDQPKSNPELRKMKPIENADTGIIHGQKIGLHASGHENKTQIKNALDKIKGIQEVAVNAAEGTIKIDYNEPATETEIRNCIENTGVKITHH